MASRITQLALWSPFGAQSSGDDADPTEQMGPPRLTSIAREAESISPVDLFSDSQTFDKQIDDNHGRNFPRLPLPIQFDPTDGSPKVIRRFISVWSVYEKSHVRDFGEDVVVALRRRPASGRVMVKPLKRTDVARKLALFNRISSDRVLRCFEICETAASADLVFEYMDCTFTQIVGMVTFPSELELAAIAGQVHFQDIQWLLPSLHRQITEALQYLAGQKIFHGHLRLSNIFLRDDGWVKICMPFTSTFGCARTLLKSAPPEFGETGTRRLPTGQQDVRDLGKIILQLVTKGESATKTVVIDARRYSADVLSFITATDVDTAEVLSKVRS